MNRLQRDFFTCDVLDVAPELLGKNLVRKVGNQIEKYVITEVEAYRGEKDLACHASKGRTSRTEVMYHNGGLVYIYLIYGMYWMLNVVTSITENPQAVLIRGIQGFDGPGKLSKKLKIDKSFYGKDLINSDRIWIEQNEDFKDFEIKTTPRIGIDYAGDWKHKPWRFIISEKNDR